MGVPTPQCLKTQPSIHSYRTPRPSPGALPRKNFIWIHGTYKVQRKHPLSYVECTHTDAGLAGMEY